MVLSRHTIFTIAAALLMVVAVSGLGFAQAGEAGSQLYGTFKDALAGNIGMIIGLGIVVLGLWTWIIKQDTGAGITMIIGGVLITLAPSIFDGAKNFIGGVVDQAAGGSGGGALPTGIDV